MITYEEGIKRWDAYHKSIGTGDALMNMYNGCIWPPDVPPVLIEIDGERFFGTREEAIALGIFPDPNKKLTIRERITKKIQNWHSRMAVWHDKRSIGLK